MYPNHCIRPIDPAKYPGASLISVSSARKDTGLGEGEIRKASAPVKIGRENYVRIREINAAVARYENPAVLPMAPGSVTLEASPSDAPPFADADSP